MGDINQLTYLERHMPNITGPVLEVGSKDYGSTATFRSHFPGHEYVGIDMADGKGVDLVLDLAESIGPLDPGHFDLGICCSVLEHVRRPWVMAENISSLIRPGGTLYMSAPWVWRYHPYPDDYFRFSWRGIIELFPRFDWEHICYSTNVPGEFFDVMDSSKGMDNKLAVKRLGLRGRRKHLPYLMVNMLGTKSG